MTEKNYDLSYFINQNKDDENTFKAGSSDNYIDLNLDREVIIECLRKVFDPELPVSIYDLGLIYKIDFLENANS